MYTDSTFTEIIPKGQINKKSELAQSQIIACCQTGDKSKQFT